MTLPKLPFWSPGRDVGSAEFSRDLKKFLVSAQQGSYRAGGKFYQPIQPARALHCISLMPTDQGVQYSSATTETQETDGSPTCRTNPGCC